MDNQAVLGKIVANYNKIRQQPAFEPVFKAVDLIKRILKKSKGQNLYVSFNGGKDATVALFLTFLALQQLSLPVTIRCLNFQQTDPFEEMEKFIQEMRKLLKLQIYRLTSKNYQKQLTNFSKEHPFDWVIMGSRKDDPGCAHLQAIQDSDVDKGYPAFKRVSPLIEWSCSFLWRAIRGLDLPYCSLYNEGYTSVGNKKNTVRNPALYNPKTGQYLPAYECTDEHQRKNRQKL